MGSRLETVTRQVLDFRAREEARMQEQAGRAERMHAHIADLEREAQELQPGWTAKSTARGLIR